MLGRRKPSRAVSAAVAKRRLAALEASMPVRPRPQPTEVAPTAGAVELADASEIEHVDERDTGDERTGAWRRRGRHAAPSPAPLRSLALTAQQVTLLALAVAAVVALAAWWVIRAAPSAEPVQLAQERVVPTLPAADPVASAAWPNDGATPQPTSAAASTALAGTVVVVDVAGKVRHPGIVELPQGSRVVDALREAGGARAGVDTSALNLARVLVDGEQIVVGLDIPVLPPSSGPVDSTPGVIAPVNVNTATIEELDTLPGIGPVTAQAILDWRTQNGAFTSVDELLEVSGIGDATLSDIEAYVYV